MRVNTSLIIKVILILLFLFVIIGCEYHTGAKIFDVTTSKPEFSTLVKEMNIKYVCAKTYGAFFTDFYRYDCFFAVVTSVDKFALDDDVDKLTISYKRINAEDVSRPGLQAKMNWWDKYGVFVLIPVLIVCIIFMVKFGIIIEPIFVFF